MWWNVERIFTLWVSSSNRRDYVPKKCHQNTGVFFAILFCFSFLILSFSPTTAEAESLYFTGTYPEGYRVLDVPFTLSNHSLVDITYDAACNNVLATDLYLRTGDLASMPLDQLNFKWYNIAVSHDETPLEGYPLNKGRYIARISCGSTINPDDPSWEIRVETSPINLTFTQDDQEPPSMEPTALTHSTSFSGWLGLWGKPDDPIFSQDNTTGHDISDYRLYSLKKGTKIKFGASWESFTASTGWRSPVMNARIEFYRDGQTYFVTNFDLLENSGDKTREITLLEDGVYKITAINVSYSDPKQYRAYTMDVILNEAPDLFLTFQSAKWVRQENHLQEDSYNLVIKFQVENTYNETKTIRHFGIVNAPGVKLVPDNERWDTETNDRALILIYYGMQIDAGPHCETDLIVEDLSKYCQYNRLGDDYLHDDQEPQDCLYYSTSYTSPYYSISPHGKTEQTISIPATLAEYRNFDESLQFISLIIQDRDVHPGDLNNDGCYIHSLYHRTGRATIPSVNYMLLKDD